MREKKLKAEDRAPYNNAFQRTQRWATFSPSDASFAASVGPLNLAVMPLWRRMQRILLLVLTMTFLGACASAHRSACKGYFPSCEMKAPRPACRIFAPADSSVYVFDPALLEGLVPANELTTFLGNENATATFAAKAANADAVWYYDASGKIDGGMFVGEEGIVAIRGCTALAQLTLVIYN